MNQPLEYLQTDEQLDVLCSLELCRDIISRCSYDSALWKWAIISLHNAVHGAIVCHLSGSMNIGALEEKCVEAKLAFSDGKTCNPKKVENPKLAEPRELLNRLERESLRVEDAGDVINITVDERNSFENLCGLRNEFLHFKPQGWSLQISGYADATCRNVLGILERIISAKYAFRHMTKEAQERMSVAVQAISQSLEPTT